jgi:predicted nuclease with RNAse H fold
MYIFFSKVINLKILGIDLAGKSKNPTGICILKDKNVILKTVKEDKEILEIANMLKPDVIAIDAPIIYGKPKIRKADIILQKYKAFPPILSSMIPLTLRGSKLAAQLSRYYQTIEVFPTATAKILDIYHKNYKKTAELLYLEVRNKHELDAYICCLTGKMFLEGKTETVGDETGEIIIPK